MKINFFVDETNVGETTMPCVPRVGEEVHLWLSSVIPPDAPRAAHFKVERIQYVCLNTLSVVDWIIPFAQDSYEVFIYLTSTDGDTQAYVEQVKALEG